MLIFQDFHEPFIINRGSEWGGGVEMSVVCKIFGHLSVVSIYFSAICQLSVKFSVVSKIAIADKQIYGL